MDERSRWTHLEERKLSWNHFSTSSSIYSVMSCSVVLPRPRTRSSHSDRFCRNVVDATGSDITHKVDQEQLWGIKYHYAEYFSHKLTRLIKAIIEHVVCYVRVSGTLSISFEVRRLALEGVIREADIDIGDMILMRSINVLGYADNIDIFLTRILVTEKTADTRLQVKPGPTD